MYDANAVMNPDFRLVESEEKGVACSDLYIQTFFPDVEVGVWLGAPHSEWRHLARIFQNKIETFPVHTNPHAQRYLSPRHGRIETIIYELKFDHALPTDIHDALHLISSNMSSSIWDGFHFGLGLVKELDSVIRGLRDFPNIRTLIVTQSNSSEIDGEVVRISEQYLIQMKKLFDRATRKLRERIRSAKKWHVRNELLAKLDPNRFPPLVEVVPARELVEYRVAKAGVASTVVRAQRQASVRMVRENVEQLAKDSPDELITLHAEIERATLAAMIERFEQMLGQQLSEARWQAFFEQNIFILTLLFARPVHLLHSQFHAHGSELDGSGAQVGDFLLREMGASLAIIEIKKPSSPLMRATAYRNTKVYAPNSELSGAITQVLYQKTLLHSNWLVHREKLRESYPDTIKCIVISGLTPTENEPCRSFEIFRHACKDVDVVTFDELLNKLKLMLRHLTPVTSDKDLF